MKGYLRFTNNIKKDIENEVSTNVFTEEEFEGLCAYSFDVNPYEENIVEVGIEEAKKVAGWNGQANADFYEGNFAILEADYVESGLDGVIIKNAEVVYEGNIND